MASAGGSAINATNKGVAVQLAHALEPALGHYVNQPRRVHDKIYDNSKKKKLQHLRELPVQRPARLRPRPTGPLNQREPARLSLVELSSMSSAAEPLLCPIL